MICLEVVPLTIESSTINTFLPRNSTKFPQGTEVKLDCTEAESQLLQGGIDAMQSKFDADEESGKSKLAKMKADFFGNNISIAFNLNEGQELPGGVSQITVAMNAGVGTPDIAPALDSLGATRLIYFKRPCVR